MSIVDEGEEMSRTNGVTAQQLEVKKGKDGRECTVL